MTTTNHKSKKNSDFDEQEMVDIDEEVEAYCMLPCLNKHHVRIFMTSIGLNQGAMLQDAVRNTTDS